MPAARGSPLTSVRRNPLAFIGVGLILLFAFCAIFGPLIAPHDPAFIDLAVRLQPPSVHHFFGTDELGRDLFSRILYGARYAMIVGCSVVTLARRNAFELVGLKRPALAPAWRWKM